MKNIEKFCEELENAVNDAYENGVSIQDAEKLAARMLSAQVAIARELETADLDSRMRKNGVKTMRAQVYMDEVGKHEKKPSDTLLENAVALNEDVCEQQDLYEKADVKKTSLLTYLGIFKDAHIFFRGVAKGVFNG